MPKAIAFSLPRAGDINAGLLVALVGIPQCLAYAMLSGLPPMYGLVTAALPGMVAALFGRSAHVTVGPTNTTGLIDRSVREMTPVELSILRMGAYELVHRIDVPFKVIINEGVELSKLFGASEGHRYVNGVLDKLSQRLRATEVTASRAPRE